MGGVSIGRIRGRVEVVVGGGLTVAEACEIARAALAGPILIDLTEADRTGPLALLDGMLHGTAKKVATVCLPLAGGTRFQTRSAARRWLA